MLNVVLYILAACSFGLAIWFGIRSAAFLLSLHSEGARINPNKWWDGLFIGFNAQKKLLTEREYRPAWRSLLVTVVLFTCSGLASFHLVYMTMPPSETRCDASYQHWETSIFTRFVCARTYFTNLLEDA